MYGKALDGTIHLRSIEVITVILRERIIASCFKALYYHIRYDMRQSLHDSPFSDFDWLAEEDDAYWHETLVEGWDDD